MSNYQLCFYSIICKFILGLIWFHNKLLKEKKNPGNEAMEKNLTDTSDHLYVY